MIDRLRRWPTYATVRRAATDVAEAFQINEEELFVSPGQRPAKIDRDGLIAVARHFFFWLVKDMTGCSYLGLGKMTGFDHTTIMHAHKKIGSRVSTRDPATLVLLARILKQTTSGP